MAISKEYVDYVVELFEGFAVVEVKRMFGAGGVYHDGVMFALIDDDVLYLKADGDFLDELKAQGSEAWVYTHKRDGAVRSLGYWKLPDSAADDPEEAAMLGRRAFEVALRKKKSPAKSGKKKPAGKRAKS